MPLPVLAELQRRRFFRALVGYGIAAFAVLQIIEPIMHGLHWPESVLSFVVAGLAVGYPIVLAVAWIFDIQPAPVAPRPNRVRIGLLLAATAVLATAPALYWYFGQRARANATARAPASVAVLPFVDLSAQKDQDYFGEGLAEELRDLLVKVPGLQVAGRTSSSAFRDKSIDVRALGQQLNVASVLEGSVRKAGTRVRVTTQLINVADGYHLWSETYDRELTDVFALQDEIGLAVVAALRITLLPAQQPSSRERRTANPEVYNYYLLGSQYLNQGNVEGYRRAVQTYEKALALDAGYAPAWARLALALGHVSDYAGSSDEIQALQERAAAAAEKAVALAPELADGYVSRGLTRSVVRRDWEGARSDYARAEALSPASSDTLALMAHWSLLATGRVGEAIALLRKATAIDPLNADAWNELGAALLASGDLAQARKVLERSLSLAPGAEFASFYLGTVLLLQAQPAEALAAYEGSTGMEFKLSGVAMAQHDLHRPLESQQALDALIAGYAAGWAYQVGEAYAWRGEKEKALQWLERAYAQRDPGLSSLKTDVLLRALRGEPRLNALLRRMNLPPD